MIRGEIERRATPALFRVVIVALPIRASVPIPKCATRCGTLLAAEPQELQIHHARARLSVISEGP